MALYVYRVVREDQGGAHSKRPKKLIRYKPDLEVGGLYTHLGRGFPGMQRVLDMEIEDYPI